jgi:hypothetical protein
MTLVLGISFPYGQIPSELPQPAIFQQGGGLRVGGVLRRLVQPPAPPQRNPNCDAPPAPQRNPKGDLPVASRVLRDRPQG